MQNERWLALSAAIASMLVIVPLASSHAVYAQLHPIQSTTIHVEDPELCGAYPVSTKELALKKASGGPPSFDAYSGRQVTIEALLSAECYGTTDEDGNYPFLTLIEIRDSDGITQHLALQQGSIEPWTDKSIGFSWIPGKPGEYQIRSFSISDLNSTVVLSKVVTTTVKVIEVGAV